MHPDDVRRVREAFDEALLSESHSPAIEHRLRHNSGAWRAFESVGQFRRHGSGVVVGIIHSREVSARKLVEAQVRQARKMEAVGLMTGAVAHDFNNLLLVIAGYVDLMASDPSPLVREASREMKKVTDRATELTGQLLSFARPTKVDQQLSCDANEVITDLRAILEWLVGRSVRLTYNLEAVRSQVEMSRSALDQVLINLAVNARDAMPSGGIVTVTTRNAMLSRPGEGSPSQAEYVVLEIADTGIGMSDTVKERIFEPFFTTKAPGCGTGLGLQTVFGIVEHANGWIEVVSAPGRGSTFRVMLPVNSPFTPFTAFW
jgi:signal transduction histidine kinase